MPSELVRAKMTVNSKCFLLLLGLLLWAPANGEHEGSAYLSEAVHPPCTCPYSCVTTNECASRHADRGTEEVLFRCDGKGKVCCPPLRVVSSRTSIGADFERPQPNENVHNVDCPVDRNTNRVNKNSAVNATTYTEPKQGEQEHFSAPGEPNVNVGNGDQQPNVYGSRLPVGTQIISTTTRRTVTAQPSYAGGFTANIANNGKQPNIYESRRPAGSQKLSTTTRKAYVQDTYTKPQPPVTTPPPQTRPLGLQNSKVLLSSHRNFDLLPKGSNCGINNFANRISEGEEVSLGEYPWMALTGVRDKYGNFRWNCGGTLINDRYVLTAAHCLMVDNRTVEYVRLGEHNLTNETDCAADICLEKVEDVAIEEVIPHENWNTTTIKNDIALIRLSRNPLILGKTNIYPICLPFEVDKLNVTATSKYEIAGWGKTDWNADQGSDVLRKASISGVSKEECNICKGKKKQQYCPITDTQLCVQGYKSVDVCKGDSGGPLMVVRLNIFQVGITSFKGSEYCGAENIPSIFTKVESYLPWILDNIRQ